MTKQAKSAPVAKATTPATKLVLLDTAAKIDAAIGTISRSGAKLDKLIHQAACSSLAHVQKHHDITIMQRLFDAMPKVGRKQALKAWAVAFGNIGWDETKKVFTYVKAKETMLTAAMSKPFWEFQPEQEYKPFDIAEALATILKRVEVARKHGDKLPEDQIAVLQALKDKRTVTIEQADKVPA